MVRENVASRGFLRASKAADLGAPFGITEVEAAVLPTNKPRIVERLKAKGRRVAIAGDGVNKAPALAAAVSTRRIAIGSKEVIRPPASFQ